MKNIFQKLNNLTLVVLIALVALVIGLAPVVMAEGEAPAGTVDAAITYTYYPVMAVSGVTTTTTTIYSSAPRTQSGLDVTHVRAWNAFDMFVTLDISGTGVLTVTPQFSPDQSNWVDGTYVYISDALVETTSVITSDGVTTATNTLSNSSTPTEQTYQIVISADGTDYIPRIPVAGEYLRFKIQYSGYGATITPTVKATLRNN